jgi:hypothetical protein
VIEVRKPNGEMLRATVSQTSRFVHPVGSPMHVEVNFKTGEAKIDPQAMSKMAQEMLRNRPSAAGI